MLYLLSLMSSKKEGRVPSFTSYLVKEVKEDTWNLDDWINMLCVFVIACTAISLYK